MTVQRPDRTSDKSSATGTYGEWDTASPEGFPAGIGPSTTDAQSDEDVSLQAVMAESTDPESRLVDRLYRALKERDAIERRRRGDR
jgi:hypothetical protein